MAYASLRDFIDRLEREGELVRVAAPVKTALEMTEIQTRLLAERARPSHHLASGGDRRNPRYKSWHLPDAGHWKKHHADALARPSWRCGGAREL